jgi:hypothetical protein
MSHASGQVLRSPAFAIARIAVFGVVAGMYVSILVMNGGKLTYTLDDPYIHLSLAEQIWHGHYGVNVGEFSSPSSSILYPFLLALGGWSAPVQEYIPFVINLASVFCTMEILRILLLRIGFGRDGATVAIAACFVALAAPCLNLITLIFTGMEQNLHIVLTAAAVLGLIIFLEDRRITWWFVASVALLPAVRYEGMGLALGVVICLALRAHWRLALTVSVFIAVVVVGFSVFLVKLGLPFLPSSVLAKSGPMSKIADDAGSGLLSGLQEAISQNLSTSAGIITAAFVVIALSFLWTGWRRRSVDNETLLAFVLLIFASGQIVVGQVGWWGRYEIYEFVGGTMMATYLLRGAIASALASPESRERLAVGGIVALLAVGFPYIRFAALSPFSANNIYEQQYNMRRFIVDFAKQPVAVSDLGYTSYRNDNYIFDMLGLGSEEARTAGSDLTKLEPLIKAHGIKFAIFYQSWWLKNQPPAWRCIGALGLSRKKGAAARTTMDFCATDPQYEAELRTLLEAFKKSLPPPVKLEILPAS